MRTLTQTCTRELFYFVGPSETIYVVAGTYEQYVSWVAERPGLQCRYVDNVVRMNGLQFPYVVRIGTWADRADLSHLERRLFEIGATDTEFPEGQYLAYPKWAKDYYGTEVEGWAKQRWVEPSERSR